MIVKYSDTHGMLADLLAEAETQEPGIAKHVLVEAASAVHHLCDQYGLSHEDVLAEAAEFYLYQQERDLKDLGSRE